MPEIREIAEGGTLRAARALLELRPQRAPAEALAVRADGQRAAGYRLVDEHTFLENQYFLVFTP